MTSRAGIDTAAFEAFEETQWGERVEGYADFFAAVTTRLVEPLLQATDVGPGVRVLDVATGPGYVAAEAARRGGASVGIDLAEPMVARARARNPDVEFHHANAQSLPFADRAFDVVVGNFALPHLSRPELAVSEAVRVLAPGGRLALTTWDLPARMRMFEVFLGAVAEAGATPPEGLPEGPDFFRFSADDELRRLFADRGLADVEVRTIAFSHRIDACEDLWTAFQRGSVRMAALVLGQSEPTRERIRQGLERRLRDYAAGGGFELPVSVKLAVGRTPID